MTHQVYAVSSGEMHHTPWLILGIFSEARSAIDYALAEARLNGHTRWNTTYVWQFTMNVPGGIPVAADQLAQVAVHGGSLNLEEGAS